uniref:HIG1 domain-containing protein n=1 Tax=Coccolithus braarudii TaxID=221442 RepID=A0A7S0LQW8_9EUKA|mmetsp:Transcript_50867/g.108650  ORF Transcript_50867/g.108650 Transcript_50867/m.108650 type:complete len:135 (+) Transcript_50867:128-532(+)|eukprot:CAMPEP_0183340054 /NCGR_PEP_ID=MMETSP0164_2-20130417/6739_1 /TAXON_ID=221442 /ORGANISM="Coccolithus pelagicus ssp braarudi, Strain PLY182g" /LENGTH=134 /DNA_ID=CAMNT_0025510131 /DNA_START=123 /DNA_END=527 /DNA_ORIENTATION=+
MSASSSSTPPPTDASPDGPSTHWKGRPTYRPPSQYRYKRQTNLSMGDYAKSNPLVPLAGAGVLGALGLGLVSMVKGGSGNQSNRLMRMRVLGQGAAVGALVLGAFASAGKFDFLSKSSEAPTHEEVQKEVRHSD